MSYCICNTVNRKHYAVCRRMIDNFSCQDYTTQVYRDYFGRYNTPELLSFDTIKAAMFYRDSFSSKQLGINNWYIYEYDPCYNAIGRKLTV